jgi:hypothetical protein
MAAVGVFCQYKKSEADAARKTELLQDISARAGNKAESDNLIRERSRALVSNTDRAEEVAAAIIKRLPVLTEEFKDLQKTKLNRYERQDLDFRLKWEPLVRSTLEKFDSLAAETKKRGIDLKVTSLPEFPLTYEQTPGRSRGQYKIREIKFGQTLLQLYYSPIAFLEGGWTAGGELRVLYGESGKLPLFTHSQPVFALVPIQGACLDQTIVAPDDGIPPSEFTRCVDNLLAETFERFLVLGNARQSTPSPTVQRQ